MFFLPGIMLDLAIYIIVKAESLALFNLYLYICTTEHQNARTSKERERDGMHYIIFIFERSMNRGRQNVIWQRKGVFFNRRDTGSG